MFNINSCMSITNIIVYVINITMPLSSPRHNRPSQMEYSGQMSGYSVEWSWNIIRNVGQWMLVPPLTNNVNVWWNRNCRTYEWQRGIGDQRDEWCDHAQMAVYRMSEEWMGTTGNSCNVNNVVSQPPRGSVRHRNDLQGNNGRNRSRMWFHPRISDLWWCSRKVA